MKSFKILYLLLLVKLKIGYHKPTLSLQRYFNSLYLTQRKNEENFQNELAEFAEPLLDFNLILQTIEQWSRPLPVSYLSRPLVFVGPSGAGKGPNYRYNSFFIISL
jgi:hypothetical protein